MQKKLSLAWKFLLSLRIPPEFLSSQLGRNIATLESPFHTLEASHTILLRFRLLQLFSTTRTILSDRTTLFPTLHAHFLLPRVI